MGAAESLAGRVLAEKYLLIERLGEGGFGSIWRAEHRVLKSPVAVKLIDLDMARKDGAVERFLREAQATAALRSPHVVQVLDYGVDGDQPFIVMELLEGENLAERLARVGSLTPSEAARIVTHVARAIGKAHELGIVHRDLKPENIFLVNNGDEVVTKVLDFGVAKFSAPVDIKQNTYTITGSLIGTPYYMSPEQAQGNKAVDHRSDLWALGVISFEMLTGKRPFDGDALGDLVLTICVRSIAVPSAVAQVPVGFDAWFAKSVERDPNARFQSAREMALALLQVIEGDSAETELRFATSEGRSSHRHSAPNLEVAADLPSRPAAEIPSQPRAAAFAATIRDDALAHGLLGTASLLPSPSAAPPPVGPAVAPAPAASHTSVALQTGFDPGEPGDDSDEPLTPWSVFGIAVLALAAGAAAVYGAFALLRAHDDSNETVEPVASASSSTAVSTGIPKRRFDVIATNKPNADPPSGKAVRNATESTQSREKSSAEPAKSPEPLEVPESPPAAAPVPPSDPLPLAPIDPITTAPIPAPPAPLAPAENLTPSTIPTTPPIATESAVPQMSLSSPEALPPELSSPEALPPELPRAVD